MSKPDWDTELDFTPEELSDMGAELLHPPERPAGQAAARRKRVSSLRIPVDAVPRAEKPRLVSSAGTPPPLPRVGQSPSDAVVDRAFQFTARSVSPPASTPATARRRCSSVTSPRTKTS